MDEEAAVESDGRAIESECAESDGAEQDASGDEPDTFCDEDGPEVGDLLDATDGSDVEDGHASASAPVVERPPATFHTPKKRTPPPEIVVEERVDGTAGSEPVAQAGAQSRLAVYKFVLEEPAVAAGHPPCVVHPGLRKASAYPSFHPPLQ